MSIKNKIGYSIIWIMVIGLFTDMTWTCHFCGGWTLVVIAYGILFAAFGFAALMAWLMS